MTYQIYDQPGHESLVGMGLKSPGAICTWVKCGGFGGGDVRHGMGGGSCLATSWITLQTPTQVHQYPTHQNPTVKDQVYKAELDLNLKNENK